MTLTTTCIFRRTRSGILSFAAVTVQLTHDGTSTITVVDDVEPSELPLVDRPPPEFITAALSGARKTVDALTRREHLPAFRLSVKTVQWRWPDTETDAVECAAGMAVHRVLFQDKPEPDAVFRDHWILRIWHEDLA